MNKELHGKFLPVFKLWCAPTTLHASMRLCCWCSHVDCNVQLSPWLQGSSSSRWSLTLFPSPHSSLLSSFSGFVPLPNSVFSYLLLRRPSSLFPWKSCSLQPLQTSGFLSRVLVCAKPLPFFWPILNCCNLPQQGICFLITSLDVI